MIKNSIQSWDGHSSAEKEEYIKRKLRELSEQVEEIPSAIESASHLPKIEDGTWRTWDAEQGEYVDTEVEATGPQGETGPQGPIGPQGNTGASVDYPYELVNNRTTDDATKGLSAAEGKRLGDDLNQLGQKMTAIENDVIVKDPLLFDYNSSFVAVDSFSELANAIVRKATGIIETTSGKGLLYFPVVSGLKYKVSLNSLYCESAYGIVSFSTSAPAVNGTVTVVKAYDSSGDYTETIDYTATADGYLMVQYGSSAQKSRISAQKEVITPVAKFVDKTDVDSALSTSSENPVQNKVVAEEFTEINELLYDTEYTPEEVSLTESTNLIVRKSNNTIESSSGPGIMYFPVTAGSKYIISLAELYCEKNYSTISFSSVIPAVGGTTTLIFGVNSSDSYTEDVEYTAASDGYVLVLYNAAVQKTRISAVRLEPYSVERYGLRLPLEGKKWSAIGDSLTEKNRTAPENYTDYIHEWTGVSVQNLGVGGTGYAKGTNKFGDRVASIASDSDIITIFGSFNDMSVELPLGDAGDTGTTSICGYINDTLSAIRAAFPLINLGVITPTPWASYKPTSGGDSAAENYVNAIIDICKLQSIPCLDLFHCSNLRPWDAAFRSVAYTRDGTYSEATASTPNAIQVTEDLLDYITTYGGLPNAEVGDWVVKDGAGVHPDEHGHLLIASRINAFFNSLIH